MVLGAQRVLLAMLRESAARVRRVQEEKCMPALPAAEAPSSPENMPFAAPCRTLDRTAPLRWLRLGWTDLMRAPRLSLAYGAVLTALSVLIAALSWPRFTWGWPLASSLWGRYWRWACIPSVGS